MIQNVYHVLMVTIKLGILAQNVQINLVNVLMLQLVYNVKEIIDQQLFLIVYV